MTYLTPRSLSVLPARAFLFVTVQIAPLLLHVSNCEPAIARAAHFICIAKRSPLSKPVQKCGKCSFMYIYYFVLGQAS